MSQYNAGELRQLLSGARTYIVLSSVEEDIGHAYNKAARRVSRLQDSIELLKQLGTKLFSRSLCPQRFGFRCFFPRLEGIGFGLGLSGSHFRLGLYLCFSGSGQLCLVSGRLIRLLFSCSRLSGGRRFGLGFGASGGLDTLSFYAFGFLPFDRKRTRILRELGRLTGQRDDFLLARITG